MNNFILAGLILISFFFVKIVFQKKERLPRKEPFLFLLDDVFLIVVDEQRRHRQGDNHAEDAE